MFSCSLNSVTGSNSTAVTPRSFKYGIFSTNPDHNIGTQLIGILAYGAFTVTCASAIFLTLKATIGLRVDAEEEVDGHSGQDR